MRVSAPSRTSGLSPLRWRSALMSSNARRSSLVAATEIAVVIEAEFEGDETLATRRARSRGETSGLDEAIRRATGLGCALRSLGFGSSWPFAEIALVARPSDEA